MTDAELLVPVEILLEEGSMKLTKLQQKEYQNEDGMFVRETIHGMKYNDEMRYFRATEVTAKPIPDFTEKFETQVVEVVRVPVTEFIYLTKSKLKGD